MKKITTARARWIESKQIWRADPQCDGNRTSVYSKIPGRAGKADCERKAREWVDRQIVDRKMTVLKLCGQWLEETELTTGTLNHRQYTGIAKNYIKPRIGHKIVADLTEQDLQDVLNFAHKKQLSFKYISNIRNAIMSMMKFARKNKLSDLHPEFLTVPKGAKKASKRALLPKDIKKLFSSNSTRLRGSEMYDWYVNAYRFLVITGMRPGELIGLQWDDIDGNILTIRRSVNELNEITDGKNENAQRSFVLPPLAVRVINNQRTMIREVGMKAEGWVFCDQIGMMTHPHNLYARWVKYRNFNRLTEVTLYELRHTLISVCKGKMNKEALEPIVGHSKSMDTFGTYGHVFNDGRYDESALLIDDLFDKIINAVPGAVLDDVKQ